MLITNAMLRFLPNLQPPMRSLFGCVSGLLLASGLFATEPVNPDASLAARQVLNLIQQLPEQSENRVLSGQHLAHHPYNVPDGYNNYVLGLESDTGQRPAILGADFGRGTPSDLSRANAVLIDHWNQGGLVTINMHPENPWTGGGYRDKTHRNLEELITEGTAANTAWMLDLARIADGLEELRDAGVVVLFRPFHEMNYRTVFWWDMGAVLDDHPSQGEAAWIAMWHHLFHYMTVERGLDNLLWVYAPADYDDAWHGVMRVYPGDDYVDIVGIDLYNDAVDIQNQGYEKLIATGKPFALTEFGPGTLDGSFDNSDTIAAIKSKYPETAYVLYWHSWNWNGLQHASIRDNANPSGLLDDPWVANLGDRGPRSLWDADALKRLYFSNEPADFTVRKQGRELDIQALYDIGGDPLDPNNLLRINRIESGGNLQLHFPTNPHRYYRLMQSTDLEQWHNLAGPLTGDGTEHSFTAELGDQPRQFFKITVED